MAHGSVGQDTARCGWALWLRAQKGGNEGVGGCEFCSGGFRERSAPRLLPVVSCRCHAETPCLVFVSFAGGQLGRLSAPGRAIPSPGLWASHPISTHNRDAAGFLPGQPEGGALTSFSASSPESASSKGLVGGGEALSQDQLISSLSSICKISSDAKLT